MNMEVSWLRESNAFGRNAGDPAGPVLRHGREDVRAWLQECKPPGRSIWSRQEMSAGATARKRRPPNGEGGACCAGAPGERHEGASLSPGAACPCRPAVGTHSTGVA